MTDSRLAWFAIGATCSAVLFGWPWHPRFSRIVPRGTRSISFPDPRPDRQPTNPFTGDPVLYCRREYLHSPSTVAECGGPCTESPEHCDCGALWVPTKPQPSGGRLITEGEWRAEWASIDDDGSFSLGLVRDHNPNPPPTDP